MSLLTDTLTQDEKSWWSRPAGGREVLVCAMPLVISSLSWTVMTFIDRMFLFQVSGSAMAAAFFASVVWFGLFCLPLGICSYANTFVSQYFGDRQLDRIGPSMWQSVWMALFSIPLAVAAIPLAPLIFSLANHGGETTQMEIEYFQILCLGGPGMIVAQAFSSFYSGRGETWVVMMVDALVTVVNLVLDYLWIFGYGGFPELGIAGAGWATVAAFWLKVAIYLFLVLQPKHRDTFHTFQGMRLEPKLFGRLLYYGGPSGMQMLLDVVGFTFFVLLVGRLGDIEAEATTLAFSISTLAFMPIFGFGMGASVLVGQHLGENRDDLAARATWTTLQLAVSYILSLSVLYVFTPGLFLYGFLDQSAATAADHSELRAMASNLLCFVAAYNLFDAMLMVFVSALKGAGDTRYILWVSLIMAILLTGLSWLAVEVFDLGIYGCWAFVTAWVWVLGITFLRRFLQGQWRQMRVIEPHETGFATPAHEDDVALQDGRLGG
ncbi:MAG: MATE family efflux transporter [Pirellulales bacterium]|nr:MATE family efflux transporter [Pirellulales bacterium]